MAPRPVAARLGLRLAVGLGKLAVSLVLALAVFLIGTYFQVRGALPSYAGHFDVKGLKAPVEILRDRNAVPHIIAGSIEDAAYGLGFVHAQDRFWQMEMMRRLGQGRLSEILPPAIVGRNIVDVDRTMRGMGVYRHAADSVNAISPASRSVLEAYAAGVNAWLAEKDQFGLELTLIKLLSGGRYHPERWQPADSIVWTKLMALTLDGNWRAELFRSRLVKKVGEDGLKFLMEREGTNADATISIVNAALKGLDLDGIFDSTDNLATRKRQASNEWVLSGAHSVSGKPLLANDPHLGLTFPSTWYLARMVGPGFDIRGASPPGVPAIALGHNSSIGWGFTTTNLDSQDLFVERVDPTDPNRYITPDGARPFAVVDETINVAWGDPVRLRIRETRHGVVVNDFAAKPDDLTPQGHVLALQATALDSSDTTIEALMRLGLAQNWDDFVNVGRKVVSPMQNIVYADTAGNIGLMSPARVPIRRKGDGSFPQPGWTAEYDWAGFVPFDDLPRSYNPADGILVNANARLVPDNYKQFITHDWAEPYRQRRANALLREVDRHAVYGMIAIQADILASESGDILPALLKPEPASARARQARDMLLRWNRFMLADRPEPLIYVAWLMELQRGVFQGRLGDDLFGAMTRPQAGQLARVLRDKPEWCDNPATPAKESCDDAVVQALERALDDISRWQGNQIGTWQWGREHKLAYAHPLFDRIPLLRDIASVRFPADGGSETLSRADFYSGGSRPFEAVHGASFRGVYDFSDLDNSRFALPLGQSGNMFSPYARNFVERWQKLSYIDIPSNRAEVTRTAVGIIQLAPR